MLYSDGQGWEREDFIRSRTSGYREFRKFIMENYPPQEVSNITGIDVKTLYEIARLYAGADRALSA